MIKIRCSIIEEKNMFKVKNILAFFTFILIITCSVYAAADLSIGGSIKSEMWGKFDKAEILNNSTDLSLTLEVGAEKYHIYANPVLKIAGFPDTSQLSDLQNINQVFQPSLYLREGYMDIYGFILPSMDIRIGKQVIIWGTADKINPTGNLCPADLSNTFDFGQKLGVNAILLDIYLSNVAFSAVFIPVFTPSLFPQGNIYSSFIPSIPPLPGTSVGTETSILNTPPNSIDKSFQAGVKLSAFLLNYDISASYYYGRYSMPVIDRIDLTQSGAVTDISTRSLFPRVHVAGLDFAGSFFSMGLWGEAGLFIPEKVTTKTYITGFGLSDTKKVLDEMYVRFVLGTDYTFKNGLYFNMQFIHGFDYEIGKDNLNEYLVTGVEKSFLSDRIKILPLTLILSTGDFGSISDDYGVGYIPEVQFFPADNVEIDLGGLILEGRGTNLPAMLKDMDSLFLTVKVSF
jgi:hypothetical protein